MSSSSTFRSQPLGVWDSLRARNICVQLKFGLEKSSFEYSVNDAHYPIVKQLYYEAEKWIRKLFATSKCYSKKTGRYRIHLYRTTSTDFTMVPIIYASDIEQNSLIEIVLAPIHVDQNPHRLYECQLNIPTFCSRCTRFITGLYKQGFRCGKCGMTFHPDCAPFLIDDCPVDTSNDQTLSTRPGSNKLFQLVIVNPFASHSPPLPGLEPTPPVAPPGISEMRPEVTPPPNAIIDKGIFPARIRDGHFIGRYLFRLTTSTLSITTNISSKSVAQTHLSPSADGEIVFALTDIEDLVLTHFEPDRDNIFEIHLRNKTVISVGKRTDSDGFQMETATFYRAIGLQREAIINPQPSPGEITIGDPDLDQLYAFAGEAIGQGAFGRVIGAIRKSTDEPVAIKIMEKTNRCQQDIRRINEEIAHLCKFNHINILRLEAYYERKDAVYLVTERMETDLCKYINNSKNGYLDEDTSKLIIFQLIVAVRYLHDNECGHLDIKCENILISLLKPIPASANQRQTSGIESHRDFPLIKLADFGYSRIIGEHSFRRTRVGTKVYNAPEIYHSQIGYNRLADVWSVGVVLYAALSGTLPFNEKSHVHAEKIVCDERKLFRDARWAHITDTAKKLIQCQLLVVPIKSRSKANDVLFDNWFTDPQLYQNLRETEKRTKYLMSSLEQDITPSSNWLRAQRSDDVWASYRVSFQQNNTPVIE